MEKTKKYLTSLAFFVCLIALWWLVTELKIWPEWILPSPIKVFKNIVKGFSNHTYLWGILISFKRLFIGFGISIIFGTLLGIVLAKSKLVKNLIGFLILGLQTLPSICWLPLALLWFGLNEQAIIFVVIMGSILSTTINVEDSVRQIPPALTRAGKMLGVKGWRFVVYILLPAILPSYVSGLKQSWSFAWRSLMSGEMLFITVGLGQLLMMGRELNNISQVIAIMIIIVAIGLLFDKVIFGTMEKALRRRWGYR